jgi:hypothetical protein
MFKVNKNIKTNCGKYTGKALSNHESFSPSQSHETVPLNRGTIHNDILKTPTPITNTR